MAHGSIFPGKKQYMSHLNNLSWCEGVELAIPWSAVKCFTTDPNPFTLFFRLSMMHVIDHDDTGTRFTTSLMSSFHNTQKPIEALPYAKGCLLYVGWALRPHQSLPLKHNHRQIPTVEL